MLETNSSNYFYGDESTQFTYFRIPKVGGKRRQRVDIYYNTIGLWVAPEPETLEQEYMAYYKAMQKHKKKTA